MEKPFNMEMMKCAAARQNYVESNSSDLELETYFITLYIFIFIYIYFTLKNSVRPLHWQAHIPHNAERWLFPSLLEKMHFQKMTEKSSNKNVNNCTIL